MKAEIAFLSSGNLGKSLFWLHLKWQKGYKIYCKRRYRIEKWKEKERKRIQMRPNFKCANSPREIF